MTASNNNRHKANFNLNSGIFCGLVFGDGGVLASRANRNSNTNQPQHSKHCYFANYHSDVSSFDCFGAPFASAPPRCDALNVFFVVGAGRARRDVALACRQGAQGQAHRRRSCAPYQRSECRFVSARLALLRPPLSCFCCAARHVRFALRSLSAAPRVPQGIPLKPLYTRADLSERAANDAEIPGAYPFTRGPVRCITAL